MTGERVYWDTCVWLAWLTGQGEPGKIAGLHAVAEDFESGKRTLITSSLTRVEVLQCTLTDKQKETYRSLFKRRNFQEIPISSPIVDLAHDIRNHYQAQKITTKRTTISTPDALHLATAIQLEVSEFHTFDGGGNKRKRGLVALSGNVAGRQLLIREPFIPQTTFLEKLMPGESDR